jgi:hypothetical protein
MEKRTQCPGYFDRDVQEIIQKNGPDFCDFYCALCDQRVKPINKDGGWAPKLHRVHSTSKVSLQPFNEGHQRV